MTAITILNGDFEILFEDETVSPNTGVGMKMVRRTAGASNTVYTTNALYSAVADAADDFQAMGFENPMLPVTPNAYTMENGYFIPRSSTEWLKEGAISADWGSEVLSFTYTDSTTDFVTGDIGKSITDGTNVGTLLDFEVLPDGTLLAWVRPEPGDDWQLTTTITVTGGTGSVTQTAVATSGTNLYSSIQVIGSVPDATEVYLIQERQKMTDYQGNFQWWTTDPNVSLGIIDILIRVQRDSTYIADGDVEVFARRYTSLYDNFRLNIAAGGRSALPLASAPDINNTTGYQTFTAQAATGAGTFTVGSGIYVGTDWETASAKGVITSVGGTSGAGSTPILEYYLVGDLTDFANGNTVQEYDFTTLADADASCTASAPTTNLGGPTDTAAGEGGTVTITIGSTTADHDGDATFEPYSVTVDAQGDVSAAKVYERIKYVCRRGQDNTFWNGVQPNVPGETYRGLEIQAQYGAGSPLAFTEGDDVTGPGGYTSRVLSNNTTDTYVMMTDQQTSLDSVSSGDFIYDEGNNGVQLDAAPVSFTSPKQSPFGTFTGSQIFGARGVLFTNPAAADTQNYILTDDNGIQRTPPNTVAFVVNNTVAGDRILVARDTGTAGIIDKDQFGGLLGGFGSPALPYNGLGDSQIRVVGPIDSEVPESGYIRVVENTLQEEHHYVYDDRTLATGIFDLRTIADATATAASTPVDTDNPYGEATLQVTGRNFVTDGVEVGMLVRNTQAGKTTQVWEVVQVGQGSPATFDTLVVRQLYGNLTGSPAGQDIDIGDTFEINKLIGDHTVPTGYAATDDVYDLILDLEASGTSVQNTFVKTLSNDFGVVVNVRQGKVILPFTQNPTVGDSGASVTVVRTPDTIAT